MEVIPFTLSKVGRKFKILTLWIVDKSTLLLFLSELSITSRDPPFCVLLHHPTFLFSWTNLQVSRSIKGKIGDCPLLLSRSVNGSHRSRLCVLIIEGTDNTFGLLQYTFTPFDTSRSVSRWSSQVTNYYLSAPFLKFGNSSIHWDSVSQYDERFFVMCMKHLYPSSHSKVYYHTNWSLKTQSREFSVRWKKIG